MPARKSRAIAITAAAIAFMLPLIVWTNGKQHRVFAFSSNPPLSGTGAPGETTCASCHSGGLNAGHVAIAFAGGSTYTPGTPKQLTVTVTDPNAAVYGYELTAVEASATSTGAGTFTAGDANSNVRAGTGTNSTKFYAAQTNDSVSSYIVNWTPPATSVGNVTFYISSVGGDGLGDPSSNQSVYNASSTLTPVVVGLPSLTVSPSTLSFTAQAGGAAPAAQSVAVTSSGAALSFTTTATSTGNWLSATPASGTTPGSVSVSVNPAGLAAGTYNGSVSVASTGAANTPQTVRVTLVVSSAGSETLKATPSSLTFYGGGETEDDGLRKRLTITSSGAPLTFTAMVHGATWLSVTPSGGTTPGTVTVSVNPQGLAVGSYSALVLFSAPRASSITVPVMLVIRRGEIDDSIRANVYTSDPGNSGAVVARWINGAGVPSMSSSDSANQGLVLSNNVGSSSQARAGVVFENVEGITLSALGFDMRQGSLCTAHGPLFIVLTQDNVVHTLGGCNLARIQPAPATGWKRYRFDPGQASPAIAPDAIIKSIALMMDEGPEANSGMVVLDNLNINDTFIEKE